LPSQDDLNLAKRKLLAIRRAERRLQHRLDDLDWEVAVLKPEVEQLEEAAGQGELPEFVVEYED
jgi:hypothetical protein